MLASARACAGFSDQITDCFTLFLEVPLKVGAGTADDIDVVHKNLEFGRLDQPIKEVTRERLGGNEATGSLPAGVSPALTYFPSTGAG